MDLSVSAHLVLLIRKSLHYLPQFPSPYLPGLNQCKETHVEDLSELERVLTVINEQLSGNEHNERSDLRRRRLGVDGNDLVLDFLEGKALQDRIN